jgi:asparagine synthase (glutamine-hydrolysing)
MCGVAGLVSVGAQGYSDAVKSMVRALAHRGPDDRGICQFDRCALAHARLSIVDLATGHKPMFSPDR